MSITVAKFGGTSMADAKAIIKVAEIIKQDAKRRYVVVSAPGKDFRKTTRSQICYTPVIMTCKSTANAMTLLKR